MKSALLALAMTPLAIQASTPNTSADRLAWFDDARFGMFIHWGVYAVPAGEWQGQQIPGIGEWIMKNGKIPVADYKAFAKDFTARTAWSLFNAFTEVHKTVNPHTALRRGEALHGLFDAEVGWN